MSDILINQTTGELALKNNDLQIVTGRQAILQDVVQTLRFLYGEWFLDSTKGLPYFQSILVKDPDLNSIQAIFIDAILAVNGVLELLAFQFDFDAPSRTLSISFQAKTTDGIINVTENLEAA